jgi:hypothetical protein
MEHVHSVWIALDKADRTAIALTLADQAASAEDLRHDSIDLGELVQWLEPGVADRGTVTWHAPDWHGADHLVAAYLLDAAGLLLDTEASVVMGVASLEPTDNYLYLSRLQDIAADLGAHERPIRTDLRPERLARIDGLVIESVRFLDEDAGVERVERTLDLEDSGRALRGDRPFTGVTALQGEVVFNLFDDNQLYLRNVDAADVPEQLRPIGPALCRLDDRL